MSTDKGSDKSKKRSLVTRFPGTLTDWFGSSLYRRIRNFITVGNIVRIPLIGVGNDDFMTVTMYFRIVKRCKKDQNFFVGVCEDPYYGENPDFPVKNGEERVFPARNVVEIPLDWHGNQNLLKNAKFRNK